MSVRGAGKASPSPRSSNGSLGLPPRTGQGQRGVYRSSSVSSTDLHDLNLAAWIKLQHQQPLVFVSFTMHAHYLLCDKLVYDVHVG